jgi:hypothetical protein
MGGAGSFGGCGNVEAGEGLKVFDSITLTKPRIRGRLMPLKGKQWSAFSMPHIS